MWTVARSLLLNCSLSTIKDVDSISKLRFSNYMNESGFTEIYSFQYFIIKACSLRMRIWDNRMFIRFHSHGVVYSNRLPITFFVNHLPIKKWSKFEIWMIYRSIQLFIKCHTSCSFIKDSVRPSGSLSSVLLCFAIFLIISSALSNFWCAISHLADSGRILKRTKIRGGIYFIRYFWTSFVKQWFFFVWSFFGLVVAEP